METSLATLVVSPKLLAMRHHSGLGLGPLLEQHQRRKERARAAELLRLAIRRGVAGVVVLLAVASLWSYARSGGAGGEADRVHCLLLLDRSASMRSATEAVVQGFNDFVSQQRSAAVEGELLLTLALFDSVRPLEYTIAAQDIRTVQPLRLDQFQPRGTAPLFDAWAKVVGHAERLEQGRQTEVVVVVMSDGAENASKEFSQAQARRHRPSPRTPMLARGCMISHATAAACEAGLSARRGKEASRLVVCLPWRKPGRVRHREPARCRQGRRVQLQARRARRASCLLGPQPGHGAHATRKAEGKIVAGRGECSARGAPSAREHCSAHRRTERTALTCLSHNLWRTQLRNNFLRGFRSAERDIRQRGS